MGLISRVSSRTYREKMPNNDEASLLETNDENTQNSYEENTYATYRPSSAGITLCSLLLTLFNAVLFLIGFIIVVVGISAHNHISTYTDLVGQENSNRTAIVMIISGAVCCLI